MKIIIEKETKDIVFAEDILSFDESGVRCKTFIAPNVKPDKYDIVENIVVPQPFIGRFFQYINGDVILKPEKEIEYNNIKNPVPQKISMRRARLVLLDKGLLASIQGAIDSLSEPDKSAAQIEWDYSTEVWRTKPFVLAIAQGLGWTDQDLDNLFREAMDKKYD